MKNHEILELSQKLFETYDKLIKSIPIAVNRLVNIKNFRAEHVENFIKIIPANLNNWNSKVKYNNELFVATENITEAAKIFGNKLTNDLTEFGKKKQINLIQDRFRKFNGLRFQEHKVEVKKIIQDALENLFKSLFTKSVEALNNLLSPFLKEDKELLIAFRLNHLIQEATNASFDSLLDYFKTTLEILKSPLVKNEDLNQASDNQSAAIEALNEWNNRKSNLSSDLVINTKLSASYFTTQNANFSENNNKAVNSASLSPRLKLVGLSLALGLMATVLTAVIVGVVTMNPIAALGSGIAAGLATAIGVNIIKSCVKSCFFGDKTSKNREMEKIDNDIDSTFQASFL